MSRPRQYTCTYCGYVVNESEMRFIRPPGKDYKVPYKCKQCYEEDEDDNKYIVFKR
jgi:DNA-directed RNA polymerase subunit RPC12/RpoP